jgi:hypothetical protein
MVDPDGKSVGFANLVNNLIVACWIQFGKKMGHSSFQDK